MTREKETRPSRQARGRASQHNDMVARDERRCLTAYYLALASIVLYGFLILLHDQCII